MARGLERLGHDAGDAAARIERRLRVLEHHLDVAAAMRVGLRAPVDVAPRDRDAALARRLQPDDQARQRALAAAAFADDADELVLVQREADIARRR